MHDMLDCGAIILAGGQSRRMGCAKAGLMFGEETLLARLSRVAGEALNPIVVVAAPNQPLPALPAQIHVLRDKRPDGGPLEGLRVGLESMREQSVARAFLCACDMPLLSSAFMRRVAQLAIGYEVAMPLFASGPQPLAAVYAASVLPRIELLQASGSAGPVALLEVSHSRRIAAAELLDVDPALQCCRSIDTPEQYRAVLQQLQMPLP